MAKANDIQVGGLHYRTHIQHWDYVAANNLDYFQGQITKYVTRWKHKNGMQDLLKAKHFLDKYIELQGAAQEDAPVAVRREGDLPRGELHPSITVPGKGEVTFNCTCGMGLVDPCPVHGANFKQSACSCAVDPLFCPVHDYGAGASYVNQG